MVRVSGTAETECEAEAARAAELPPQDENNEELDYYDDVNRDTENGFQPRDYANVESGEQRHCPHVQPGVNEPRDNIYAQSGIHHWCHHTRHCRQDPNGGWDLPGWTHHEVYPRWGEGIAEPIAHWISQPPQRCVTTILKCVGSPYQWDQESQGIPNASSFAQSATWVTNTTASHNANGAGATASPSKAIYSATTNLGTLVPHHNQRMPTRPPDQAQTDQAMRVLEGINKAPGMMLDHSEPRSVPWG